MGKVSNVKIRGVNYEIAGLKPTLLWENEAPTASFAGQTITLSDYVDDYDFIGIICARGSSNAENRKEMLPLVLLPVSDSMGCSISFATYRNYRRDVTDITDDKVTFGAGGYFATYGTNTTQPANTTLIPRYIYGFKN